ncbi:MAG: DedA family protein [Phycisphaerae bacterium]|nr:DedA family protein [Phycisphaerae bacterium]
MRFLRPLALVLAAFALASVAAATEAPGSKANDATRAVAFEAPGSTAAPNAAGPGTWDGDGSQPDEPEWTEVAPDGRDRLPKWIEQGIRRYGPISVFFAFIISGVGLHLSEDLILIPAGFLAAGDPHHPVRLFWEFAFWAYLGIVVGDAGWFWMCSTFGTRFLHSRWFKRFMHPRRLLEIKHQMDRRGALVLIAARFIPGTRTPVITMGGLLHMKWWKFLLVELTCVLASAPLQMAVGWFAAKAVSSAGVTRLSHQIAIGVAVTIAFVVLMYFVHVWVKSRQSRRRPPRAPARWLRLYDSRVVVCPQ